MAFKIILDANLLLDLILNRSNDSKDLDRIYQSIVEGKCKGFITTSIVQIVGYWVTKAVDVSHAKKILMATLNDLKVIDAPHSIVENALRSDMKDIEDALQYYTATHHKLDVFVSKDKDFIKASRPILPVFHPKDFIKHYIA